MARPKVLYLEWLDSSSMKGAWHSKEVLQKEQLTVCQSIGYIVCETKESITLAGHRYMDDFSGELLIPKCAVIRRRVLRGIK